MPLNFPGIFPPSKEINLSFSWIDFASATGYVTYDFFSSVDTVGINRSLIESSNATGLESVHATIKPSTTVLTHCLHTGSGTSGTFAKIGDFDFDTSTFQLPRTVRGDFTISWAIYMHVGTPADNSTNHYFIIKIRKYDGSTETDLASIQTPTIEWGSEDQELDNAATIAIPETLIKKGDLIRVTMEIWARDTGGGKHHYISFAGDPANLKQDDGTRDIDAGRSRIQCNMPFKIDL